MHSTKMGTLILYGFNDAGEFTGTVKGRPSPLEPGTFLYPRNSTDIEPPNFVEGKIRKFVDGEWIQEALPIEPPPIEDVKSTEQKAAEARVKRNILLQSSDFTQLADAPFTVKQVEDWKKYRKALRDLPAAKDFPNTITWPKEPK